MQTYKNYLTTSSVYGIADNLMIALPQQIGLREMYKEKPITLHQTYRTLEPMKWPKVIKVAYAKIWSGRHPRVIIKAPRGGGKSKLLGTIGFNLWFLKSRKVVNMAGSAVQATQVYSYFRDYCDIHPSIVSDYVDGEPLAIKTTGIDGNYFSSITASTKQTRGKHPDALISDETCETADELVYSALPMVNDSKHPLVIMASTFHKIYGIFQETWDNAEERGYLRIQWDIFDVCAKFPADIWDREDIKNINGIERLKRHARGRTGDPDGWIPIMNVIQAWKEKPTEEWFEVEYLGSRPSAAGLVLKPEDIDDAFFDEAKETRYRYVKRSTTVLGIDWGFSSMTAVTEIMGYRDGIVVLTNNKNYSQVKSSEIIKEVVQMVKDKGIMTIYADSAGKFENAELQNELVKAGLPCKVVEVVFSKEKVGMLGNLRAHFEQKKFKASLKFKEAYWQFKRYRYQDGTMMPVKKDDHIPDSTMCALQHFKLNVQRRKMIVPKDKDGSGKTAEKKQITAGLERKVF